VTGTVDRPRLLIPTTTFPRWRDDPGPAPFVYHHAKAMSEHFRVTVLAPHHKGAAIHEEMEGIEVRRFRYGPDSAELLADGAGIAGNMRKGPLHKIMAAPLVASELFALVSGRFPGYDYVNAHWMAPSGVLSAMTAGERPLIITAHAADYDLLRRMPGGAPLVRYMAGRAKCMVCVSERLSKGLSEMGVPEEKIVLQPMGVPLSAFTFSEEEREKRRESLGVPPGGKLIAYAGKLSPKKGVSVLLEAFARLPEDHLLVIAGDGDQRTLLENEAHDLGLSGRVTFLGAVPNRELPALYSAADVVAVPSVTDPHGETEGMPVVILEALACGAPVVATDVCSVPKKLLDTAVNVVPESDPEALSRGITSSLKKGRTDTSIVEDYDVKKVAARYTRLFLEEGP